MSSWSTDRPSRLRGPDVGDSLYECPTFASRNMKDLRVKNNPLTSDDNILFMHKAINPMLRQSLRVPLRISRTPVHVNCDSMAHRFPAVLDVHELSQGRVHRETVNAMAWHCLTSDVIRQLGNSNGHFENDTLSLDVVDSEGDSHTFTYI